MCYGTDFDSAMTICGSGFDARTKREEGAYGRGIYFSSNATYACPIFAKDSTKIQAIIICWVLPGNPFPVIEHPDRSDCFQARPLKSGYQCHYAVVDENGYPTKDLDEYYDELVISQETQAVPIFVLSLKHIHKAGQLSPQDLLEEESSSTNSKGKKKMVKVSVEESSEGEEKVTSKDSSSEAEEKSSNNDSSVEMKELNATS